ncbi:MAG: hypothetical protein ACE5KS_04345 [Woeseiaceae bacterium]
MRTFLGFVTLALLPGFAQAEGFDYTYVEVGYISADFDTAGINVDGDGFGINGSFAITDTYHLFAEYSSLGFDFSIDLNQLAVGGGMHFGLSPTIDFVGTLAYLDAEVDSPVGSVSEDGFGIGIGVRGALNSSFEWEAGIDYADVGGSDTSFGLDGRYYFTDTVAAGAGISFDDDVTVYAVGIRVEFGK